MALRYFNAAGAADDGALGEEHDPETHLIPLALQAAAGLRGRLKIFGTDWPTPDGTCIRDYIHVEDLAEAHLLALETAIPGVAKFMNIGTGHGHSVQDVVRTAGKIVGREVPADLTDRRPGDVPTLLADPAKAYQELGWKARRIELEQIIGSAWQWMQTPPKRLRTALVGLPCALSCLTMLRKIAEYNGLAPLCMQTYLVANRARGAWSR